MSYVMIILYCNRNFDVIFDVIFSACTAPIYFSV